MEGIERRNTKKLNARKAIRIRYEKEPEENLRSSRERSERRGGGRLRINAEVARCGSLSRSRS